MPLRYQDVSFGDLGGGIDQLSPENKIPEGFSEYLKNVDPTPNGSLKKRVGYQLYGALPARVAKIRYTNEATNNICFYLDAAVNVLNLKSTPILVYGRTSEAQSGDFSNQESSHYYDSLVIDVKKEVAADVSSSIVLEGDAHAQGNLITGLVTRSTNLLNLSGEQLLLTDQIVTKSNANLAVPISNYYEASPGAGPTEQSFFMVAKRRSSQSGISYVASPTVATGTQTISYPASVHNLASYSLGVEIYLDEAGNYYRLFPDELSINANGDVSIQLTNNYAGSINLKVAIFVLPSSNTRTFTISGLQNLPFQLPINKLEGKFPIFYIYRVDDSGTKHLMMLDSLSVDDPSNLATAVIERLWSIDPISGLPTDISVEFLWDYADLVSNEVCVTGSPTASPYTDPEPQLTIWGLPQEHLYGGNPVGTTPGWVSHLDVYRATSEERAIAGLGGNLFAAYEREETPAVYGLPIYYPSLRGRVDQQVTIGPIITATNPASLPALGLTPRTKGNIYCSVEIDGNFDVTAVQWISGNQVEYTLQPKDGAAFSYYKPGVPSPTVSDVVTTNDYLSIGSMGHPELEGDFRVVQASQVGQTLKIRVTNSKLEAIRLADPYFSWNFSYLNANNTYGRAGFFTDSVPLLVGETNKFLEGDRLLGTAWGSDLLLTVTGVNRPGHIDFLGIDENLLIPDGLQFAGARTSNILPLRELTANRSVTNIVVGDVLHYTGASRDFRAKFVNAFNDETVTIVGDGTTATVTLSTLNTKWLEVGQRVLLVQAGSFSGEQVITEVSYNGTFEFASTYTGSNSGVLLGRTVEIDETYAWQDNPLSETSLEVVRRWLPIETPTNTYAQLPNTHFRHLTFNSYASQPSLRSSMVNDTMYFTNGDDAVMRFDGNNLTRAGLERWQAGLFMTADTSTTAKILDNSPSWSSAHARVEARFQVSLKDGMQAAQYLNQKVKVTDTNGISQIGRIKSVTDDGTEGFIEVDFAGQVMTLSTSSSANFTIQLLRVYRYYYRLNLFDANNNVVVSAVTGNEDAIIEVAGNCAIRHTLQRPHWMDLYDYARIEIELYRTKANATGPYYRLTTLKPSWNNSGETYLQYVDVRSDNDLLDTDWDAVNVALGGQELGTTWSGPLRAKYLTSAKGRLVLANVRSWPKISLELATTTVNATVITSSQLADKRFLLRKSNLDVDTTTDNLSRMAFEFRTNGRVTPSAWAIDTNTGLMTITSAAHGLVAGDWVYLFRYANLATINPRLGGHYQVVSSLSGSFTVQLSLATAVNVGATPSASDVDSYVAATVKQDVPVWLSQDYLLQTKEGNLDGPSLIMNRLANAINSAQNACTVTGFTPWVTAQSDRSFRSGTISLETNYVSAYTLEVVLPSYSGFNIYANGLLAESGQQVQAVAQRYPSRLLISYPNYPEVFDAPTATSDFDSESAIDVNPADGQEITGVIPFFGDSAFGAAQKDSILLVFKTASAYLVNISAKVEGQNAVQKLDTRGLGCTAPYSIAPTQNGIMFANKSGIYRITTNLDLQYIGKRLERVWKESVDGTQLEEQAFGHYYPKDNYYKLSVPFREDELAYPNRTLVYNTVREYSPDGYRDGSWTTYQGMPAVGWANMLERSLFASPTGEVFTLRQAGDESDYRDDGIAIDAVATLRAMDFGSTGIRKSVSTFALQFKTSTEDSEAVVYSAIDLREEWEELDPARIARNRATVDGLGTQGYNKVRTIQFTSNSRKGVYYQIRVRNDEKDQGMELAGVSAMVAALNTSGVLQARET